MNKSKRANAQGNHSLNERDSILAKRHAPRLSINRQDGQAMESTHRSRRLEQTVLEPTMGIRTAPLFAEIAPLRTATRA
jgi:hypothetical protein